MGSVVSILFVEGEVDCISKFLGMAGELVFFKV